MSAPETARDIGIFSAGEHYAVEQAHRIDPDEQHHAATGRILDHYLHTAYTADQLLDPARDPLTLAPPRPGVTPEHPADYGQALDWFTAEDAVLLAAVDHAAATGFDTHTWQLAWTLIDFLNRRGRWHDKVATQHAAVAAARRLADLPVQARTHRSLGNAYTRLGRFDDAHTQIWHALDLYRQAGDLAGQLLQELNDRDGQAATWDSLGYAHHHLGHHTQAIACYQHALDLVRDLGRRYEEAVLLIHLGDTHHATGNPEAARTAWQQALTILDQLDHPDADQVRTRLTALDTPSATT